MAIVTDFDRIFKAGPGWISPPPPTEESLAEICRALGVTRLPSLLVELAWEASYFGTWFAGVGPDIGARTHILPLNAYWRGRGLPARYLLLTFGFDDDCDCLDLESSASPDEMRVVQVSFFEDEITSCQEFAPTFEGYLKTLLEIFEEEEDLSTKAERAIP
jgi:hypothetical protein